MELFRKENGDLQVCQLRLIARGKPAFTLFPMIHVGDRAYFHDVARRADAHDMVLKEGVRAAAGRSANRAHAIATTANPHLAAQSKSMDQSTGNHWVNADIDPRAFQRHWSAIPLSRRLLFHLAMPLLGLALRFRAVRRRMIDGLADFTDTKYDDVFGPGFHKAVVAERDRALIEACTHTIDIWDEGEIAVVWGAAHIPPLVLTLMGEHGYRIETRYWATALSAQRPRRVCPCLSALWRRLLG